MALKVTKFREDELNCFEIFSKNPQGAIFAPTPSLKRVNHENL